MMDMDTRKSGANQKTYIKICYRFCCNLKFWICLIFFTFFLETRPYKIHSSSFICTCLCLMNTAMTLDTWGQLCSHLLSAVWKPVCCRNICDKCVWHIEKCFADGCVPAYVLLKILKKKKLHKVYKVLRNVSRHVRAKTWLSEST